MTTRYNIQILSTGLFVLGASVQAEEPEWFSATEAFKIASDIDRDYGRNVTRVNACDFGSEGYGS